MTDRERLERYFREEVESYYVEARHKGHEDDALKSVCHVIFWACALDEFHKKLGSREYAKLRDEDADGRHLAGVRYARDRATHQFPQVLNLTGGSVCLAHSRSVSVMTCGAG